jgi:hypothetical protein
MEDLRDTRELINDLMYTPLDTYSIKGNDMYTREEKIEILEGKRLDCQTAIQRAFNEENKAKARIELRRIEAELKLLKEKTV